LALPQQSLYSFPDPQGHLSLGFGMKHLQLLASYTEYCTFRVSARKKFHGQSKKGLTFGTAREDALVQMCIKPAPKSESSRACCMHETTSCASRSVALRTADDPRVSESSGFRSKSAMDVSADVASMEKRGNS
jgi:hypothetical protein